MRYPASEKLEIIRLVEQSHLPVRFLRHEALDRVGSFDFRRDVDQSKVDPFDARHLSLPIAPIDCPPSTAKRCAFEKSKLALIVWPDSSGVGLSMRAIPPRRPTGTNTTVSLPSGSLQDESTIKRPRRNHK